DGGRADPEGHHGSHLFKGTRGSPRFASRGVCNRTPDRALTNLSSVATTCPISLHRVLLDSEKGTTMSRLLALALLVVLAVPTLPTAGAQEFDPKLYDSMRWRMIGPFRGGRTVGAVGIPSQPNVFFIGVNNGGVWKTTDYGVTWKPLFDDQPTGS